MFTKDDADVEVVKVVMVILVVVVFKLLFSSGKELGMIQCRNAQSWFCESSEMCVVWIAEIRQEWNNRNNRGIASMHSQSISRADWFLLAADMHFFCKWRDIVMVMFPGERSSQLSRKQTPKRIVNSILLLSNYVVVCLCWDVSAGQALTYYDNIWWSENKGEWKNIWRENFRRSTFRKWVTRGSRPDQLTPAEPS